jgi:hypothetical protein
MRKQRWHVTSAPSPRAQMLPRVTDAFVRINSQGKGMTEAHMLRALTHMQTIDTERHFHEVRARLEPLGWAGLDAQGLVNILKAWLGLDVYTAGVRGVRESLQKEFAIPFEALSALPDERAFLAVRRQWLLAQEKTSSRNLI